MRLGSARSWKNFLAVLGAGSFLLACSLDGTATKKKRAPVEPGADWWGDSYTEVEQPLEPEGVNDNAGVFGAQERPSSSSGGTVVPDNGPKTRCTTPIAAGDLAIVELMISSRPGPGDEGEWVEIQNTRSCWLNVQGVSIESPRGAAAPNVVTITADLELAPRGTFLVASSGDSAKNHNLPGPVFAWDDSDVLKNDGDTITVKLGDLKIDTLTYPNFTNLSAGRSLSFPRDCKPTDRASWARWSLTFNEFGSGYKGTPNDVNDDVACF